MGTQIDQTFVQHARMSLEAAARRSLEELSSDPFTASVRRSHEARGSTDAKSSRHILDVQEIQRMSKKLIDICSEAKHNKEEIAELNRFVKTLPFDLMEVKRSPSPKSPHSQPTTPTHPHPHPRPISPAGPRHRRRPVQPGRHQAPPEGAPRCPGGRRQARRTRQGPATPQIGRGPAGPPRRAPAHRPRLRAARGRAQRPRRRRHRHRRERRPLAVERRVAVGAGGGERRHPVPLQPGDAQVARQRQPHPPRHHRRRRLQPRRHVRVTATAATTATARRHLGACDRRAGTRVSRSTWRKARQAASRQLPEGGIPGGPAEELRKRGSPTGGAGRFSTCFCPPGSRGPSESESEHVPRGTPWLRARAPDPASGPCPADGALGLGGRSQGTAGPENSESAASFRPRPSRCEPRVGPSHGRRGTRGERWPGGRGGRARAASDPSQPGVCRVDDT